MDKRELRLAIEAKLNDRRRLMTENSTLRTLLQRERERTEFLGKAVANPLIDRALEDCADEIIRMVMDEAIKASEVIIEETALGGDYVVGIDIASLHIRQHLSQRSVLDAFNDVREFGMSRRVSYDNKSQRHSRRADEGEVKGR